jgi:hypothetical protein
MNRTFKFLGDLTEDGFLHHDRDEVRTCLLDLEGAVFQLGGVVSMSAVREQVAPGDFITTGVVIAYDSYSPTRGTDRESPAVPDPVTATPRESETP